MPLSIKIPKNIRRTVGVILFLIAVVVGLTYLGESRYPVDRFVGTWEPPSTHGGAWFLVRFNPDGSVSAIPNEVDFEGDWSFVSLKRILLRCSTEDIKDFELELEITSDPDVLTAYSTQESRYGEPITYTNTWTRAKEQPPSNPSATDQ